MDKTEAQNNGNSVMLFLSQNNYLNGLKCLKYAWHYKHRRNAMPAYPETTERVFDYGHMIGARLDYCRELLKKRVPLFECSLIFNNAYAQSDLLIPAGDAQFDELFKC